MYLTYLLVWIAIIIILNLLYRVLPVKMKETEDPETKNTLFTLLLVSSVPLLLIAFLAPIIILAGDENMPDIYKIYFVLIAVTLITASFILKKKKTKT